MSMGCGHEFCARVSAVIGAALIHEANTIPGVVVDTADGRTHKMVLKMVAEAIPVLEADPSTYEYNEEEWIARSKERQASADESFLYFCSVAMAQHSTVSLWRYDQIKGEGEEDEEILQIAWEGVVMAFNLLVGWVLESTKKERDLERRRRLARWN